MLVKMNDGHVKDVPVTEVTPENYIVPENAKHVYHCIIEVKKFDAETGARLSRPRIQKFGKKAFESMVAESLRNQGYTITILHDPNEFIAQAQQNEAEAKANAEKKAFDEAVAKAVAEKQAEHDAEMEALRKQLAEAEAKASTKRGRPSKAENEAQSEETANGGTNTNAQ